MEIKSLDQALKLQSDLTARLTQNMLAQQTGKKHSIEEILKEMELSLAHAQSQVDSALSERDAAVKRWDERVAQRKEYVARLKAEMSDLKDKLKQPSKTKEGGNIKKDVPGKMPR